MPLNNGIRRLNTGLKDFGKDSPIILQISLLKDGFFLMSNCLRYRGAYFDSIFWYIKMFYIMENIRKIKLLVNYKYKIFNLIIKKKNT